MRIPAGHIARAAVAAAPDAYQNPGDGAATGLSTQIIVSGNLASGSGGFVQVGTLDASGLTFSMKAEIEGAPTWITPGKGDQLYINDENGTTMRRFKLAKNGTGLDLAPELVSTSTKGVDEKDATGQVHMALNEDGTKLVSAVYGSGNIAVYDVTETELKLSKIIPGGLWPDKEDPDGNEPGYEAPSGTPSAQPVPPAESGSKPVESASGPVESASEPVESASESAESASHTKAAKRQAAKSTAEAAAPTETAATGETTATGDATAPAATAETTAPAASGETTAPAASGDATTPAGPVESGSPTDEEPKVPTSKPHQIFTDPSGNNLLVPDLEAGAMIILSSGKDIEVRDRVDAGKECGPRHLAAVVGSDPKKATHYILTCELSGHLSIFEVNYDDEGALSLKHTSSVPSSKRGLESFPSELLLSKDNKHLYVGNRFIKDETRTTDTISHFSFENGNLTMVEEYETGGFIPRKISIGCDGGCMLIGHQGPQSEKPDLSGNGVAIKTISEDGSLGKDNIGEAPLSAFGGGVFFIDELKKQ